MAMIEHKERIFTALESAMVLISCVAGPAKVANLRTLWHKKTWFVFTCTEFPCAFFVAKNVW